MSSEMSPLDGGMLCKATLLPLRPWHKEWGWCISPEAWCPSEDHPRVDPTCLLSPPIARVQATQLRPVKATRELGTQMPQLAGQSTPCTIFLCQPNMRVYTTEDLDFSPFNFRYYNPPAISQLQTSILSLVGIPASNDLTIMTPIYTLL